MNKLEFVEKEYLKDVPKFRVGDTVKGSLKGQEGDKTRTQVFDPVGSS